MDPFDPSLLELTEAEQAAVVGGVTALEYGLVARSGTQANLALIIVVCL